MTVDDRKRLMAKSLLAFGRSSRWKAIMNRGRVVTNPDGSFKHTAPITVQEIEDTMDYILKERERIQSEYIRQENDQRNIREGNPEDRGSPEAQGEETVGDKA